MLPFVALEFGLIHLKKLPSELHSVAWNVTGINQPHKEMTAMTKV